MLDDRRVGSTGAALGGPLTLLPAETIAAEVLLFSDFFCGREPEALAVEGLDEEADAVF